MAGSCRRVAIALVLSGVLTAAMSGVALARKAHARHSVKQVVLTQKDASLTRTVKVGTRVVVRLASKASTGYRWSAQKRHASCLREVGRPIYRRHGRGARRTGVETFTYRAVRPGKAELEYVFAARHHRPKRVCALYVNVRR